MFRFRFLIIVIALIMFSADILHAQIHIVSGLKGEIYNQFAKDISNNTSVRTKIYTTQGSQQNLSMLQSDSIQLAFLQYDVLHYFGREHPEEKKYIKVFVPLYKEEVQLVTLKKSGIHDMVDLIGKRVGMGDTNSGSYFTAKHIQANAGIEWKAMPMYFGDLVDALKQNRIDAFFFVGAAPSNLLTNLPLATQQQLTLVSIHSPQNDNCYIKQKIPSGTYAWQQKPVETYSVMSLIAVNTKNVDGKMALMIDSLYNDLKYNLKGIQLNKFSHPKWKSVVFSNMNGIDWPVYREEYTLKDRVYDSIGWLAALLSMVQIYFIINKLWKRKHERVVAESISISAMFISLIINTFFAITNLRVGGYAQLTGNMLWIIASTVSMIIGVGLFVNANKGERFFSLLIRALNLERNEAGDLAKAFFQPSSADKIIDILSRLAMIDNDLDKKEKAYIQKFADDWHIDINWNEVEKYKDISGDRFNKLRESLNSYLKMSPPKDQVRHLIDVIVLLINADGKITREEAIMQEELGGLIREYIGDKVGVEVYKIAVVPRDEQQEEVIAAHFPELTKIKIAGGDAYISEDYYSEDYAEEISRQYRSLHVFSIVFKPGIINNGITEESLFENDSEN